MKAIKRIFALAACLLGTSTLLFAQGPQNRGPQMPPQMRMQQPENIVYQYRDTIGFPNKQQGAKSPYYNALNLYATLFLPTETLDAVTESGNPLSNQAGITAAKVKGNEVCIELGQGTYCISCQE